MATAKQLAANRHNALKSTGPKTADGKAVSKMNAIKHGILSREVVVRGLHVKESPQELADLRDRFWEHLAPVGPLEEMLVDEIVTLQWRRRRAVIAETGEITRSVNDGYHKPLRQAESQTIAALMMCGLNLESNPVGVCALKKIWKQVRASVLQDGELTAATLEQAARPFPNKPNPYLEPLIQFRKALQDNPDHLPPAVLKAEHRKQVLAHLDAELVCCERALSEMVPQMQAEEQAAMAAGHLPSSDVVDKILRYETALERQLYRAMNQLERLQRRRQGEHIPAPLAMEIGTR